MIVCTRRPDPALSELIENYWLYDGYISAHARERILPSGTFELVFNLRQDELRIYSSAHPTQYRRYCGAVVSGPYAGYFGSDAVEEVSIMGVHFRVGGAFSFLGLPAGELADRHIDLVDLWKSAAGSLHAQLVDAPSNAERFRVLEQALIRQLWRGRKRHPAVAHTLKACGEPNVQYQSTRELARAASLSERRFIDVFRAEVGITPKVFLRIQRFQRALSEIRAVRHPEWSELAATCGYFDQAHLIRDFRQFTGITPGDYVGRLNALHAQGAYVKGNHLPVAD